MLVSRFDLGNGGLLLQWKLGAMENFTYLIVDEGLGVASLIDPGWDADFILTELDNLSCRLESVLLTHHHFDHVDALGGVLKSFPKARVYATAQEKSYYNLEYVNETLNDGDFIKVGNLRVQCILTPGHTSGSCCYFVADRYLCTGDTLFVDSCGRCDLEGGSAYDMQSSLKKIVSSFSDDTVILPGHKYDEEHDQDTLANQKRTNYYLRFNHGL